MKPKYIFTLILILYIIGIIILASLPSLGIPSITKYDKILHFAEFFILTLILLKSTSFYKLKNRLTIVIASALIIAITSELIQFLVPNRAFSLLDFLFDIAGISLALLIRLKR